MKIEKKQTGSTKGKSGAKGAKNALELTPEKNDDEEVQEVDEYSDTLGTVNSPVRAKLKAMRSIMSSQKKTTGIYCRVNFNSIII